MCRTIDCTNDTEHACDSVRGGWTTDTPQGGDARCDVPQGELDNDLKEMHALRHKEEYVCIVQSIKTQKGGAILVISCLRRDKSCQYRSQRGRAVEEAAEEKWESAAGNSPKSH